MEFVVYYIKKMCKFNVIINIFFLQDVCTVFYLGKQHTQRNLTIPRGMDEQNNGRTAQMI